MSARPGLGQCGPVAPAFTVEQLQRAFDRGVMRLDPEYGLEKLCRQCGEWWPADSEFWPLSRRDGLHRDCKGCSNERKIVRREEQEPGIGFVNSAEQKFLQQVA